MERSKQCLSGLRHFGASREATRTSLLLCVDHGANTYPSKFQHAVVIQDVNEGNEENKGRDRLHVVVWSRKPFHMTSLEFWYLQ